MDPAQLLDLGFRVYRDRRFRIFDWTTSKSSGLVRPVHSSSLEKVLMIRSPSFIRL